MDAFCGNFVGEDECRAYGLNPLHINRPPPISAPLMYWHMPPNPIHWSTLMGLMFTTLFATLTTLISAFGRFANTLDNLGQVAEVSSISLVEEQQANRAKAAIAAKKELLALK